MKKTTLLVKPKELLFRTFQNFVYFFDLMRNHFKVTLFKLLPCCLWW